MYNELCNKIDLGLVQDINSSISTIRSPSYQHLSLLLRYYNALGEFKTVSETFQNYKRDFVLPDKEYEIFAVLQSQLADGYQGITLDLDSLEHDVQSSLREYHIHEDLLINDLLYMVANYNTALGNYVNIHRFTEQLISLAREYEDPLWFHAKLMKAKVLTLENRLAEALEIIALMDKYVEDAPFLEIRYNNLRALYFSVQRDFTQAKLHYSKTIDIFGSFPNKNEFAFALKNLAIISTFLGDFKEAGSLLKMARSITLQIGYAQLLNYITVNYANLLLKQGDYPQSIDLYLESLDYYPDRPFSPKIHTINTNLGVAYSHMGDVRNAFKYYSIAFSNAEKLNYSEKINLLYNLSDLSLQLFKIENAKFFISQMEVTLQNSGLEHFEAQLIYLYGRFEFTLGNFSEALSLFERALNKYSETRDYHLVSHTRYLIARIHFYHGQNEDALYAISQCIAFTDESKNDARRAHYLFLKFQIYMDLDQWSNMYQTYIELTQLGDELVVVRQRLEIAELILTKNPMLNVTTLDNIIDDEGERSEMDVEFKSFILNYLAIQILTRYKDEKNMDLLIQFTSIIDELFRYVTHSTSRVLYCNTYMLYYKLSAHLENFNDFQYYLQIAKDYALEGSLSNKLLQITYDEMRYSPLLLAK